MTSEFELSPTLVPALSLWISLLERMQVSTVNGPRNNRSLKKFLAAPASPTVLSIQNVSSFSNIDGLAGLKVTWSISPRDVNGLFVGIDILFQCSSYGYYIHFSSYEEGRIQMMCDCDYHGEINFVKNGTEFVITNLTRFLSLPFSSCLFETCFFSYSWYDIYVLTVSQVEPGGRQYRSDWNTNIVLTAEDSKANSDLLLLMLMF